MYNSSYNCKGAHRIAILNYVVDCLLEVNSKAYRNKRAQKCPLVPLKYDSSMNLLSERIIFDGKMKHTLSSSGF